jgi:protein involved in polysaccharide export with SLBB domain
MNQMFAKAGLLTGLMLILPLAASAQGIEAGGYIGRDSLVQLLKRSEETASSRAYSSALRDRARRESELLRSRLENGDFQVGDRILLTVERQPELTDTFTVRQGPVLPLPEIREFPLTGLLRAELEPRLTQHLKAFLVDPRVQATPLMRIWIDGGVTTPGVYLLPSHSLVTDAFMQAGGTTRDARLNSISIVRDNKVIWEGESLQKAITEGRTLDQLSMRAGDRIVVAEAGRQGGGLGGGTIGVIMALIPLLTFILQVL